MGEEIKFEKVRADDGIHTDGIEANGVERPANVCALAIITVAVTLFAVGAAVLLKGVIG